MSEVIKTVLELTAAEAREYMLKGDQYCTFRLPEYFVFDDVLDDAVWRSELFNVRLAVVFCVSERDYLYPLESLQLVYSIIQI